jgi:hypothetical protein
MTGDERKHVTEELDMPEEYDPESEAEALSDAVFEEGIDVLRRRPRPASPSNPPTPGPTPATQAPVPDDSSSEIQPVRPSPDSPLRDYVRELQQEFEEQEEEGKL